MKMHKIILPIVTVLTVVSCTQPRLCGSNVDRILGQLTTDEKLHLLVGASGLSGEDTTEVEMQEGLRSGMCRLYLAGVSARHQFHHSG